METAIGTFREYKVMMESFTLYVRQGLRTTLELIRAIINDEPLNAVQDRTEMYDDPYSILIHFADRCDMACEFWNEHISTLSQDIKLQLSMRVYSYAIMNVPQDTYERLKQKGAIVRWSQLLLDFMETIIRFFTRNRHQDLMEYLLILALHHEKMKIPSTLLGNMGEWLDEVFATQFDEDTYNIECSDAIQFVYAFVGEVMSGAYEKPIYDTQTIQQQQLNNDAVSVDVADEINENIVGTLSHNPGHLDKERSLFSPTKSEQQQPTTASHTGRGHIMGLSGELQFPTSFKSVVQIPTHEQDDEDLTLHQGHFYGDSNYTLPKPHSLIESTGPGHFAQPSYTFNLPKSGYLYPASTTLGPKQGGVVPVSNLDLDSHPSLTDMFIKQGGNNIHGYYDNPMKSKDLTIPSPRQSTMPPAVSAIHIVEHAEPSPESPNNRESRPTQWLPSLRNNISAPPRQSYTLHEKVYDEKDEKDIEEDEEKLPRRKSLAGMNNLKPPGQSGQISMYIANSPLSQLDSPTLSPQPMFEQPGLTPNAQSYDHDETMEHTPVTQISVSDVENVTEPYTPATVDGGRAVTFHTSIKNKKATTPTYSDRNVLNVNVLGDELERPKGGNMPYKRPNRRQKKRSFSQADNHVVKFLAPNSQHNYTNSREQSKNKTRKKNNKIAFNRTPSRTSSSMLLEKHQEKTWKPMHFLQKIMDLEGNKIIKNYAFAPSDGSLSEKIVDLSIFHVYFEAAEQFWSRYIDVNDKTRNKINDKLLNIFSQRITDAVRYSVSELFAQKQINFVQMFSLYFKLVRQYLDKCKYKTSSSISQVNPALLPTERGGKAAPHMTPSLKYQPNSSQKTGPSHKRTYSQRNSMSLGLNKFGLRAATLRDGNGIKGGSHYHNEGQFFVREMLRIGRKHRSHNIQEKTLKLVAKCLIEVIEKQFSKRFNDKTKRAFTIALKLGIKFMCVESNGGKSGGNYYNNSSTNAYRNNSRSLNNDRPKPSKKSKNKDNDKKDKKEKKKSKHKKDKSKPFMRTQSAQTFGGGFID